jgi:hypothetical protein
VGCKAARDLLVQALTQEAGNIWPSARNLRGSELVLDRGIRVASRYGCWGTRVQIVGCPYWGSFEMPKCLLPCSSETICTLPTGASVTASSDAGGGRTLLLGQPSRDDTGDSQWWRRRDICIDGGPERIGPEGSQILQSGWFTSLDAHVSLHLLKNGG